MPNKRPKIIQHVLHVNDKNLRGLRVALSPNSLCPNAQKQNKKLGNRNCYTAINQIND